MASEDVVAGLGLDAVRGFVFDVDGTLAHRGADGRAHAQPGAVEVLEAIRASGRPLVLFTNGSHVRSEVMAEGLRRDGIPVSDAEMLTPVDSAITYLKRRHAGQPIILFGTEAIHEKFTQEGIELSHDTTAGAVFVAHTNDADMAEIERAARAVEHGAALLAGSYARGYAGREGVIISRGAMVTAAIAKGGGRRPKIIGKPSHAALAEISRRLGVPTGEIAVIGDDAGMDIALGNLGGARTVLVASGMTGSVAVEKLPARQRPDAVIGAVAELLPLL